MKDELEKLVNAGNSDVKIGEILGIHRTTVPKWMKKFGIVREKKIINHSCKLCGKEISDNPRNRSCCPTCVTRIRRYRLKKKAVEYKGGECERCGYNKSLAAMEFHHNNSDDKDFTISEMNHKSWRFIKTELDKCTMLCSNCHREEHSKYDEEKFLNMVE